MFTTVRNHWDAWVSWWGYSSRDGEQFDRDFIDRILTRQTKYYPDPHRLWGLHSPFADRIVRFEDLQAGLDDVWGGPVPLPHHNISKKRERRPYHEFYTPKLRSWVARHYAEEIEELGYSFEDGA